MKKYIINIALVMFLINCLVAIFAADTKMTDSELKTWLKSKSPNGITCYPYLLDSDRIIINKNDSIYNLYTKENSEGSPLKFRLVWNNKNHNIDPFYTPESYRSWDYINSPKEPTFKELQKKFPDNKIAESKNTKNTSSEYLDKNSVDNKIKNIVNKYKSDSNVYRFDVKLYPNKLLIEKIFTNDNVRDKFIEYETIDPKTKAINATPIFENKLNFNNIEYISKIYEVLNSTSREKIIYHNNKIIWRQTYATGMEGFFGYPYREPEIYDIVKLNNNMYAILFVLFYNIKIDYIHTEYEYPVIERYNLPHVRVLSNSFGEIYPSSGHFINSNIVKLEWDDGNVIEYWKARLNRADIINNKKVCKDVNEKTYVKSLLWWNGVKMKDKSNFADYKNGKSWDYIDSPNEPTLEELQERFPDDNIK